MSINKIPVVFFGTHDFAATILQGLIDSPLLNIELVITQPDRPVGRKQELEPSPVKLLAQKNGITCEQPETLKNFQISQFPNSSLFIVAQYGLLIPKNILDLPPNGTINVHTSLLPKYRGASPIQSALINGETITGITIMLMDVGMDTGPILSQHKITIDPDDTYESLDKKMANVGRDLLLETLPDYVSGEIRPQPQNDTEATVCKKLDRDDGKIDWHKSAQEIYNLYRGLYPWPGVWTTWEGKRLKLLTIKPADQSIGEGKVMVEDDRLLIGCVDGSIEILKLQLEGKTAVSAKEFIVGYQRIYNTILS